MSVRDELKQQCSALKGVDQKLIESVLDEVIPGSSTGVTFNDVSGQQKVVLIIINNPSVILTRVVMSCPAPPHK